MQTTSLALDHLLRAIGDPVVELREVGPMHPEFHQAQASRAGASMQVNFQESILRIPDGAPKLKDVPQETGGSGVSIAE